MIRFVDPRAQPAAPIEPYALAWGGPGGPPAVGILGNGFPDAAAFADELAAAIRRRLPGTTTPAWHKPDDSIPADDATLAAVADASSVCIALYGH